MNTSPKNTLLVAATVCTILGGCSESGFRASAGKVGKAPAKKAEGPAEVEGLPEDGLTSEDCITIPGNGDAFSTVKSGTAFKNSIFHRVVAVVDPSGTSRDPANTYKPYKPYPISASTEMASTVFELSAAVLRDLIKTDVKEIEYFAFAHQFLEGLDKITMSLHTDTVDLKDVSTTNIYSAYGYLSVKNIKEVDGKIIGDVDIFSFNYHPQAQSPLLTKIRTSNVSPQDGTDIIGPASEATTPKVSQKAVALEGFKVTIDIGADRYDSVQYRAIRASLWTEEPLSTLKMCQ